MFLVLLLTEACAAYRPVVFIHGFNGTSEDGQIIDNIIQKLHPKTLYYSVNGFIRTDTLKPLWDEVAIVKPLLIKYMKAHPGGIHLICYSQGGLVCRGLLSTIPDHNVHTLIGVSSPMAGIYGDFKKIPPIITRNAYRILYSKLGQRSSIGNYWKDPHHLDLYEKFSNFLAPLNNDSLSPNITEFKHNFLRVKRMVLVGGPDDGLINPWQSSLFGFYDENEIVQDMKKQRYFTEDSFGLRTMYEQNRLFMYTIKGIVHRQWVRNPDVIKGVFMKWFN